MEELEVEREDDGQQRAEDGIWEQRGGFIDIFPKYVVTPFKLPIPRRPREWISLVNTKETWMQIGMFDPSNILHFFVKRDNWNGPFEGSVVGHMKNLGKGSQEGLTAPQDVDWGRVTNRYLFEDKRLANTDLRINFCIKKNYFLVNKLFTFGHQKVQNHQQHLIYTTNNELLLYRLDNRYLNTIETRSLNWSDRAKYTMINLSQNTVYSIPPLTEYVLLSPHQAFFSLFIINVTSQLPAHATPTIIPTQPQEQNQQEENPQQQPENDHTRQRRYRQERKRKSLEKSKRFLQFKRGLQPPATPYGADMLQRLENQDEMVPEQQEGIRSQRPMGVVPPSDFQLPQPSTSLERSVGIVNPPPSDFQLPQPSTSPERPVGIANPLPHFQYSLDSSSPLLPPDAIFNIQERSTVTPTESPMNHDTYFIFMDGQEGTPADPPVSHSSIQDERSSLQEAMEVVSQTQFQLPPEASSLLPPTPLGFQSPPEFLNFSPQESIHYREETLNTPQNIFHDLINPQTQASTNVTTIHYPNGNFTMIQGSENLDSDMDNFSLELPKNITLNNYSCFLIHKESRETINAFVGGLNLPNNFLQTIPSPPNPHEFPQDFGSQQYSPISTPPPPRLQNYVIQEQRLDLSEQPLDLSLPRELEDPENHHHDPNGIQPERP